MFIFVGSVFTLMKSIFEGSQEPLFGRATARMYLDPLPPDTVAAILEDHGLDAPASLPFFHTLFGSVPKYYFLLDRYQLFKQPPEKIIRKLFVEADAPLQNEGRELLIEEFGKNYHLYFSILQVVASGETQMARIADRTGINVNSISKYLDELTNFYQILERRLPVTDYREGKKRGRYYLRDQTLRFWFRYIFRNRTLIEIGDEDSLIRKILEGLPTLMGRAFEELVRSLLLRKNDTPFLPFRFNRIGAFWSRRGDVEMDIVALDDEGGKVLFGECKLAGHKVTRADIQRLREKARQVKWLAGSRQEYYALFSAVTMPYAARAALAAEGVIIYDLPQLLAQANAVYQKPEEESQNGTVLFFNREGKG
jgi:AAA+ ATPase superfamily predicted ATPase